MGLQEVLDVLNQQAQALTAVHQHLAPQQIHGLDAVGALVDGLDAYVAEILLDPGFADVAVATEALDRQIGADHAVVGEEGLDHRGQEFHQLAGTLRLLAIRVRGFDIHQQRRPVGQCPPALYIGLLREQHAPHIRVLDDGVGHLPGLAFAGGRPALQPIAGVGHRLLIGALADAQPLKTHAEAGLVHHQEHGLQTAIGLADQPASGAFQVHHAGGITVDAHLVFQRAAADRVALAGLALCVRDLPGHQK